MEFEWDTRKASGNYVRHGIDFEDAIQIFLDPFRIEKMDERANYQEERFKVIGRVEGRILVVIYTERQGKYRIISARRATTDERRSYQES